MNDLRLIYTIDGRYIHVHSSCLLVYTVYTRRTTSKGKREDGRKGGSVEKREEGKGEMKGKERMRRKKEERQVSDPQNFFSNSALHPSSIVTLADGSCHIDVNIG